MPQKQTHKQCHLHRGDSVMVSWIPTHHAIVGHIVDLDPEGDGWEVTSVGDLERDSLEVAAWSRDWRTQRKASDI